jgi:hypothetical protein
MGNEFDFKNPSTLYPFTVSSLDQKKEFDLIHNITDFIVNNSLLGTNFINSAPDGFYPIGSYVRSDADLGGITFSLKKGNSILYTSGPGGNNQIYIVKTSSELFKGKLPVCIEWCYLEFSSNFELLMIIFLEFGF